MTKSQRYQNYMNKTVTGGGSHSGLFYLAVGGAICGWLALLFASKPGVGGRQAVSNQDQKINKKSDKEYAPIASRSSTTKHLPGSQENTHDSITVGEISVGINHSQNRAFNKRSGSGRRATSIV